MEFSSPGLLLVKLKNLDFERCIICQNINDGRGSKKLTSTDNGKRNLIEYSNTLPDNILRGIDEHDLGRIKYCYSRYKRKSYRANEKKSACFVSPSDSAENEEQGQETCRSSKRLRFDEKKPTAYRIICSKLKCKRDTKLCRMNEKRSAKSLSTARLFKDDVQTRYNFWKTPGNVFAAYIMYRKNCLSGYVWRFKREVELIMRDIDDIEDECTETIEKYVFMSMNLTSAYHLSDLREKVARQLSSRNVGECILYEFIDCIIGKTLLCFQAHSKCVPQ